MTRNDYFLYIDYFVYFPDVDYLVYFLHVPKTPAWPRRFSFPHVCTPNPKPQPYTYMPYFL